MCNTLLIVIAFGLLGFIHTTECSAQLAKPTITSSGIGWGWFTLTMHGHSVTPKNTRWIITEGADTVLDTYWGISQYDSTGFRADEVDTTVKEILGCKSSTTYIARVAYNDGKEWSPFSDSIVVQTPAAPELTGSDTIYVTILGDSFGSWGDQAHMKTSIRLGEETSNTMDNFGHMLQTQLRRLTGKKVKVINRAQPAEIQKNYYDTIRNLFPNDTLYSVVIMFFGTDAAHHRLDVTQCGAGITDLTSLDKSVFYSSLAYTEPKDSVYIDTATAAQFYSEWKDVIAEKAVYAYPPEGVPEKLHQGLDLYDFLRNNKSLLGPDGVHPNLSEAVRILVEQLSDSVSAHLDLPPIPITMYLSNLQTRTSYEGEFIHLEWRPQFFATYYNVLILPPNQFFQPAEYSTHDTSFGTVLDYPYNTEDMIGYVIQPCNSSGCSPDLLPTGFVEKTRQSVNPKSIGSTELQTIYPNPASQQISIDFTVGHDSPVTITVYDITGRTVNTITTQSLVAGHYTKNWNISSLQTGMYQVCMQAGEFSQMKPLIILH